MTTEQDNDFRLQPDTQIPDPNAPFAGDLMGRKPQADALVKLATGVSGPAVIAVDAPYGVGKSTFLSMVALSPELRDAANVIEHNAWETEFSDMPFNSLVNMVMASAQSPDAKQLLKENANLFTKHSIAIFWKMMPFLASGVAEIPPEAILATTGVSASVVQSVTKAVAEFKKLRQLSGGQKRIVIIIDELDRCTPGYAIKTLEAIHHVFDSDGITFVLGLHRQQLMESIKAIYGQGFDAEGYLDRFIDMTIPLPSSRDDFIKTKLSPIILYGKIPHFDRYAAQNAARAGGQQAFAIAEYAQNILLAMPNINARSIDRFAKNLIAVMNVMPSNRDISYFAAAYATACIALAVKIQSPSRYQAFNEDRASDNDLYNLLGTSQLPLEREASMVAAILIAAQVDISLAASSLSDDARRQEIDAVSSGISKFAVLGQLSESDKDTLNNATEKIKTHSPLHAQLCEQFGSTPDSIGGVLRWVSYKDFRSSGQELSHWQEVANIIDLTT